jgi:hypothetical protein
VEHQVIVVIDHLSEILKIIDSLNTDKNKLAQIGTKLPNIMLPVPILTIELNPIIEVVQQHLRKTLINETLQKQCTEHLLKNPNLQMMMMKKAVK